MLHQKEQRYPVGTFVLFFGAYRVEKTCERISSSQSEARASSPRDILFELALRVWGSESPILHQKEQRYPQGAFVLFFGAYRVEKTCERISSSQSEARALSPRDILFEPPVQKSKVALLFCYISSILIKFVLPECPVVSPPVITIRSFLDKPSSFDAIFFAV